MPNCECKCNSKIISGNSSKFDIGSAPWKYVLTISNINARQVCDKRTTMWHHFIGYDVNAKKPNSIRLSLCLWPNFGQVLFGIHIREPLSCRYAETVYVTRSIWRKTRLADTTIHKILHSLIFFLFSDQFRIRFLNLGINVFRNSFFN